ncbi:MAG: hypothetical protein JWO33_2352 [Caulobacteraceae bacterium]|nr:hypothetical protein [Caulobacteraceae bacterium]
MIKILRNLFAFLFTSAGRGRQDGRLGHPRAGAFVFMRDYSKKADDVTGEPPTAALSPYEATIIKDTEEGIERRIGRWEAVRHALESQAEQLLHRMEDHLRRYALITADHAAKSQLRQPYRDMTPRTYLIVLGALFAMELVINLSAFNGWFKDSNTLAMFLQRGWRLYLAAAVPAFLVPFAGDSVGKTLKHARAGHARPTDWVITGVAVVAAIGVLTALAGLRQADLGHHGAVGGQTLMQMFAMNLGVLVAGVLASYSRHDEDPHRERRSVERDELLRRLHQDWSVLTPLVARFDRERGVTLADIAARQQRALALCFEWRDYRLRHSTDAVAAELNAPLDERFFKPRALSHDLGPTPRPIRDLIAEIDGQATATAPPSPPTTAPDQASHTPEDNDQ